MQPRNFEEPRKPTSARHQTAPAPDSRAQSNHVEEDIQDQGEQQNRSTQGEDEKNGGGEGGTENPRSSGGVAWRPAQVRKPWISEATSGSRPPAPPAMVALAAASTLSLSTCALSLALAGEEDDEGGGRRLENREKSHKVMEFFTRKKKCRR